PQLAAASAAETAAGVAQRRRRWLATRICATVGLSCGSTGCPGSSTIVNSFRTAEAAELIDQAKSHACISPGKHLALHHSDFGTCFSRPGFGKRAEPYESQRNPRRSHVELAIIVKECVLEHALTTQKPPHPGHPEINCESVQ